MNNTQAFIANYSDFVFDLDGTLMHTEPDIRLAANRALLECGFKPLSAEQPITNLYGTAADILASIMGVTQLPETQAAEIEAAYFKHYAQQAHAHSFLYPDVSRLLHALIARGCRLGVCTNKIESAAKQALERHHILHLFDTVIGGDTTTQAKPHAKPLLHAVRSMGATTEETILIGDTHVDALCAANCNMPFIFHRNGYGNDMVNHYPIAGEFSTYSEIFL